MSMSKLLAAAARLKERVSMQSEENGPHHQSNKGGGVGCHGHGADGAILPVLVLHSACCPLTDRSSNLCVCLLHVLGSARRSAGCSATISSGV